MSKPGDGSGVGEEERVVSDLAHGVAVPLLLPHKVLKHGLDHPARWAHRGREHGDDGAVRAE